MDTPVPTIDVEALKARRNLYIQGKADLENQAKAVRDNIVATHGAIDALTKLIQSLEAPAEPAPVKKTKK